MIKIPYCAPDSHDDSTANETENPCHMRAISSTQIQELWTHDRIRVNT